MIISRLIELNHKVAPPPVKPAQQSGAEDFQQAMSAAIQSKQPKAKPAGSDSQAQAGVSNEKPAETEVKEKDKSGKESTDTSAAEQAAQPQTKATDRADEKSGDGNAEDSAGDTKTVTSDADAQAIKAKANDAAAQSAATEAFASQDAEKAQPNAAACEATAADAPVAAETQAAAETVKAAMGVKAETTPAIENAAPQVLAAITQKLAKQIDPKRSEARPAANAAVKNAAKSADASVASQAQNQAQKVNPADAAPPQPAPELKPAKNKIESPDSASATDDRNANANALPASVVVESAQSPDTAISTTAANAPLPTVNASGTVDAHAAAAKAAGGEAASAKANATDGDAARLTEQATRALRSVVNQKGGSVTLRLTPPELGALRVRVEMNNSLVSARFEAQTEGVRSILQSNMSTLRQALESQGLTVQHLHVQMAAQPSTPEQSMGGEDGRSRGSFDQQQSSGGGAGGDEAQQRAAQRRAEFEQQLNLVA